MENHSDQCQKSKEKQIDSRHDENCSNTQTFFVYNSIPPFSQQEAEALRERLVNDETYRDGMKILIAWLERGQCNERNCSYFYYLIELCSHHLEKLKTEHEAYVIAIRSTGKSLREKSSFQLPAEEFLKIFSPLNRHWLWPCFDENQELKLKEMMVSACNLEHNIQYDCVGDASQIAVSDEFGIEIVTKEYDIAEMKAKLPYLTNELNTVYRLTKDMKAECVSFWTEWPEIAEPEYECPELRLEMKNWILQEKTSKLLDNQKMNNGPVDGFATKLKLDINGKYFFSFLALFLNEYPEGVNLSGIYSFIIKNIRPACPVEVATLLKRHPQFFEISVPTEATVVHKEM